MKSSNWIVAFFGFVVIFDLAFPNGIESFVVGNNLQTVLFTLIGVLAGGVINILVIRMNADHEVMHEKAIYERNEASERELRKTAAMLKVLDMVEEHYQVTGKNIGFVRNLLARFADVYNRGMTPDEWNKFHLETLEEIENKMEFAYGYYPIAHSLKDGQISNYWAKSMETYKRIGEKYMDVVLKVKIDMEKGGKEMGGTIVGAAESEEIDELARVFQLYGRQLFQRIFELRSGIALPEEGEGEEKNST